MQVAPSDPLPLPWAPNVILPWELDPWVLHPWYSRLTDGDDVDDDDDQRGRGKKGSRKKKVPEPSHDRIGPKEMVLPCSGVYLIKIMSDRTCEREKSN